MKLTAAALLVVVWSATAAAQTGQGTNINPAVGSVWTYLGPTYGAAWAPPGVGPSPFILSGTITGVKTVGNSPGDFGGIWTYAGVSVTADTATNTMSSGGIPAWSVVHNYGGTGAGEASRFGIWSNLLMNGPLPLGTGQHVFHTGIFSNVNANFNAGGSGVTYAGQIYGYGAQVAAGSGYTNTYGVVGGEVDVANSSASTLIVEGWGVGSVPLSYGNPTRHGLNNDAGYGLWAGGSCGAGAGAGGSGCVGFLTGISFGRSDSYYPIADNGTIISAVSGAGSIANMKSTHGIDFHNVTFSGYSLYLPGFLVHGDGNTQITAPFVNINFKDTGVADTAGGRARIASNGSGSYCWQINSAAAGDYSTEFNAYCIYASGDLSLGSQSPIATTSVQGFARINSMAGAPTGTPINVGAVPLVVDTTNNKLCYYNGAWRCL
jgi:hypothetical protein